MERVLRIAVAALIVLDVVGLIVTPSSTSHTVSIKHTPTPPRPTTTAQPSTQTSTLPTSTTTSLTPGRPGTTTTTTIAKATTGSTPFGANPPAGWLYANTGSLQVQNLRTGATTAIPGARALAVSADRSRVA